MRALYFGRVPRGLLLHEHAGMLSDRSPRRAQAKRSPEDKAVQKTLTGVSLLLVVLAFLKK